MTAFLLLAPISIAITWRLLRRKTSSPRPELGDDERLRRIEQAVESIAVEVERVSEHQRFLTKSLAQETERLTR